MPPQFGKSTSWRKKRQTRGSLVDIRRKAKADRERFRRGKRGVYKRLNDLYLDGLDTGREVRIYTLFMRKPKGCRGTIQYSTYNSHPHEKWVPSVEEVVSAVSPQIEDFLTALKLEWMLAEIRGVESKQLRLKYRTKEQRGRFAQRATFLLYLKATVTGSTWNTKSWMGPSRHLKTIWALGGLEQSTVF